MTHLPVLGQIFSNIITQKKPPVNIFEMKLEALLFFGKERISRV
jgi:hypothetical protein